MVVAVFLVAGCYFGKYDKLARTHVQLLLAMAQKLEDVTREQYREWSRAVDQPAASRDVRRWRRLRPSATPTTAS